MRSLRSLIRKVAAADSTVLILGESGSGKELVARAVHTLSQRAAGSFVPINCGAIPSELLESELFGHRKGAFTGAVNDRKGRFEMAQHGSLFLDEIGDMRFDMQVKLLRVLQERVIDRVGDQDAIPVNVRVIAATHRNLDDAVSNGTFRADLFYRLNVFPLVVPSLREREGDVEVLFNHFAQQAAAPQQKPVRASQALKVHLNAHSWPGNCRELINFVERLTVLWPGREVDIPMIPAAMLPGSKRVTDGAGGPAWDELDAILGLSDLAEPAKQANKPQNNPTLNTVNPPSDPPADMAEAMPPQGIDLKAHLGGIEQIWIKKALHAAQGNVTHAAEMLGMRRTTLIERMRKYALSGF
jgi:sigma-54 dependent transcriptional regulator, flagellar regulatory protein